MSLPYLNDDFKQMALAMFKYQAIHNTTYAAWVKHLGWDDAAIQSLNQVEGIPFLPIGAFKHHAVKTGNFEAEALFTSSGSTGDNVSTHHVANLAAYLKNTHAIFSHSYAPPEDFAWLCLLPSYLEREGSSLVAMASHFIEASVAEESGFFLKGFDELKYRIDQLELNGTPTILLGVSFALMDFAEWLDEDLALKYTLVMETGGMKGRREEPSRESLHATLKKAFGLPVIHSEYGMTELMSQAYSKGDGLFRTPPHMKVFPRNLESPLEVENLDRPAGLNIVDLANASSCAFIATDDIGLVHADGSFHVQGRLDNADLRGCNLLVI
ncbi:MAG: acyl transferase [Flavobacteriales bacterium]|jgi:phenylacetate-coenzyme A ligase PaaK-like adenylate-forming protein|nr:acyl transferase [Schleiferiaceae bacterium]